MEILCPIISLKLHSITTLLTVTHCQILERPKGQTLGGPLSSLFSSHYPQNMDAKLTGVALVFSHLLFVSLELRNRKPERAVIREDSISKVIRL